MNDTLFDWMVEGLGKGVVWLGLCLVLARWGGRRGWRIWRTGWLVLGAMTLLSVAPALWHWTWAEPARQVMSSVEAGLAPVMGIEMESTVLEHQAARSGTVVGLTEFVGRPWLLDWSWRHWLVAGWLVGALAGGGWLAWGFAVAERWRREAVVVEDPGWLETLGEEAAALGVARLPVLAVHAGAPGPCLVGVGRRPTLVLPGDYRNWDLATRRAVVRHELAHVLGRDGMFAVLRTVLLAVHWPNPLAWVAAARDRREQELAADRLVLASGMDRGAYATLLLRLARHTPAIPPPAACHSMANLSNLEGRFRAILGEGPPPKAPRRWARGMATLAALGVAVGAGCSSYRSPSSDPSALQGPGTPRVPVMDGDLRGHLAAAPSEAPFVTLKFRIFDGQGRRVKVDFPDWPGHTIGQFKHFGLGWNWTTPMKTTPPTKLFKPEIVAEFVYPTAFDLPHLSADSVDERRPSPPTGPMVAVENLNDPRMAQFPVTPTTPTAFAKKDTGWKIDGLTVEPKAAFLVVRGRFVETLFDGFVDGAGEAFSPIVAPATTTLGRATTVMLTENQVKQPTFVTRETPFVVSALPGKAYRVRLNTKQPGWFLEVRAEPHGPNGPKHLVPGLERHPAGRGAESSTNPSPGE
jgi:hypothetical protein